MSQLLAFEVHPRGDQPYYCKAATRGAARARVYDYFRAIGRRAPEWTDSRVRRVPAFDHLIFAGPETLSQLQLSTPGLPLEFAIQLH